LMIIIIVSAIWFVVPAYQEMSQKRSDLKESTAKLVDLREKSTMTDKLSGELQSKNVEQALILSYLPTSVIEEQVIDNLNYIASAEGVSIYNLSVKRLTAEAIAAAKAATTSNAKSKNSLQKTEVTYGMIGSYDKIKSVLQKVYKLKRYNSISSISVKKVFLPGTENQNTATDNLQADVKLAFDYLEEVKIVDDLDNPLFTQGQFTMKAVEDINSMAGIDVAKINPPATGRTNPFLP